MLGWIVDLHVELTRGFHLKLTHRIGAQYN